MHPCMESEGVYWLYDGAAFTTWNTDDSPAAFALDVFSQAYNDTVSVVPGVDRVINVPVNVDVWLNV